MKNYFKDKKNILIAIIILLIVVVAVFIFLAFQKSSITNTPTAQPKVFKGIVINDNIKIPNTISITGNTGEIVPRGEYNVKIQPQAETEQVIISQAKLTLKFAYELAAPEASKWSLDQKLIFIKSNGALGLDGKSSSWQLIFSSAQKKRTYEIIILGDKIVNTKEINSFASGFDLPSNWYDSYEAIASLSNLPQFSTSTLSAISFYYSVPAASWSYGLAVGDKTTSMWVK